MKVGIAGAGAVGLFYGTLLARCGHEVHFLMRSGLEAARRDGVQVFSAAFGDFHLQHPLCAADGASVGACEVVVVSLKATANESLLDLLPPLIAPATLLVTLQNGLGNEDFLARHWPGHAILGGLCFVCLHRVAPASVAHLDHGAVSLGEHAGCPRGSAQRLAALFGEAGVAAEAVADLRSARWRKLVWNIPFNGLAVACGVPVSAILASPALEARMRRLMAEVCTLAAADGCPLPPTLPDELIARTRSMGDYKPSSLLDWEAGRALELDAIWGEPLRRARRLGVPAPELEQLESALRTLPP